MTELRKTNRKKRQNVHDTILGISNDDELKYLEKVVLGTGDDIFGKEDSTLVDESFSEPTSKKKKELFHLKKPAWVDEEDNFTLNEVLQKQNRKHKKDASGANKYETEVGKKFQEIMGIPKWASEYPDEQNCSDDILKTCREFIKKSNSLNKGSIEIKKLRDLNCETHLEGTHVSVVKFHPKSMVAMIGGNSGIISFVQVDGKSNTKLQSIQFQRYPIFCGSFLKNGEEVLVGSRHHRYFFCHNLITGKSTKVDDFQITEMTNTTKFCVSPNDDFIAVQGNCGKIYLFVVSTKEYADTLQMNCNVTALSFNGDGSLLYSHGEDGEVYIWEMKSRRCIRKFVDDGCLSGTSLGVSNNDQFLACGSSTGVVNIYDSRRTDPSMKVSPTKTIYNLLTPISSVKFNSSSEILSIASNHKKGAIRLVHCSSMSVFSNFPGFQSAIENPLSVDFSQNSGYFAVGDNNGVAHLFRLKHYGNY